MQLLSREWLNRTCSLPSPSSPWAHTLPYPFSSTLSRPLLSQPASQHAQHVSRTPPLTRLPRLAALAVQAYLRQRSLFLRQVGGVSRLPLLKQYLLLYSSISLPKLAGLLETDEATLRTALACLKKSNYW